MTISVRGDYSDIEGELRRLAELPAGNLEPLERALQEVLTATVAIVHVVTGSLKASGRAVPTVSESHWTGTMTFGGPSPGSVYDPVRYAQYEVGRGGEHNFLAQAIEFGHVFPAAVGAVLTGDK